MLPNFLIEETTIRQSGESEILDCTEHLNQNLLLTLNIAHAVERESIELDIYGSQDGVGWARYPALSLPPVSYCGTYKAILHRLEFPYLKAVWRVKRWAGADRAPFFRLHIFLEPALAQAMAGAA